MPIQFPIRTWASHPQQRRFRISQSQANRVRLLGVALFLGVSAGWAERAAQLDYNLQIRPILADNCFSCHGPDKDARKSRLRLDEREVATAPAKSGLIAITPGKLDASELVYRITSEDVDERMPPKDSHKALKPQEIALLKQWIAEGATYARHWAFEPIRETKIPSVKNARWPRNPIDAFVLARLETEGLSPSVEAEKSTVLRRVTLDLTGLPPALGEIDAFLADASPNAYEKVVDRLLASKHYGERMALDWLDAARYADTNGYQADRDRDMYAWRDWVIRAFNENKRFDDFTVEQLAGDLLPNPTLDQIIATGFNRNQPLNLEGGVIAEEFLAEYNADRVETTSTVWLGLTLGCARCHDHKFDPLTQKDFYRFKAFFHNASEPGNDDLKLRKNAPFAKLSAPELEAKLAALGGELAAAKQQQVQASVTPGELTRWSKLLADSSVNWSTAEPTAVSAGPANAVLDRVGQRVRIGGSVGLGTYDVTLTVHVPLARVTALRLKCAPADTAANLVWQAIRVRDVSQKTKDGASSSLKLYATESGDSLSSAMLDDILDTNDSTVATVRLKDARSVSAAFELGAALTAEKALDLEVVVTLRSTDGDMIWSVQATDAEPELLAASAVQAVARTAPTERTAEEQKRLVDSRTARLPEHRKLTEQIAALTQQMETVEKDIPTTMVMDDTVPRKTFVLIRGVYDQPGEEVAANTPEVLLSMPEGLPRNRLGLARWLTDRSNPLPARVQVNRFWQSLFGSGIVGTADNFGSQGESPSHPELLDWLAGEFIGGGWDVKKMMRLLVTSATYRQSSRLTPTLLERDPENRLLARGPRFRLQAEFVRDQALAASGLLIEKIGGPSVKPYHPPGLYEQIGYDAKAIYAQGKGDDLYRRSLYTYWKRSIPSPTLTVFDAPFRETCVIRRPRTNTPLQALVLLNDPTFVEAARFLAQRMLEEGGETIAAKLSLGFRLAVAREPRAPELAVLQSAWTRATRDFQNDPKATAALLAVGDTRSAANLDSVQLAALTVVANSILNLDETITKQ